MSQIVVTSELREGDIVLEHGMRCLIDGPMRISTSHPDRPGLGDGKTRYYQALVLNRDEVSSSAVPYGWTRDWNNTFTGSTAENGEHRWTIQGNDLARWAVERS